MKINAMPAIIELGNQNENNATTIEIDVSEWLALYPDATFSITYTRPGETTVYPASGVALDETMLKWTVGAAVTAYAGNGSMVVHCVLDGAEKRSVKAFTHVWEGHAAAGNAPEPLADYVSKWGAVDVAVSVLAAGATPTGAVTQDATGTHIALGVPAGATGAAGSDATVTVDTVLDPESANPIENKAVHAAIALKVNKTELPQRIYSVPTKSAAKKIVSFYFDDGYTTDYTLIKPIADIKNIPITIALIPGLTALSTAQLLELQQAGWEAQYHTMAHSDLRTLTEEQLDADFKEGKEYYENLGVKISSICYPYGYYNSLVMKVARRYFRAGLSSAQGTNYIPLETYQIKRVSIGDYGIDNLKARVDNMGNEWIIFFGHSDWDAASQSKFVELVDYVQGKGIEITTVNTALDIFENTLEVTNDADATKSFVVGADGMVYSSQINNLNGIFAAPHTVNNDTPITSFEKHKTTSVSFTASSSSGITVSNGAGTLIAYRINDDDALNFQVFYPYNDSYTYRRKWSVANSAWLDWTTTVDKVYVDELTNKYRMLGMNIFASTAGIGVFDYGITIYDVNSGGSTGFPATAGTVITYKTPQDPNWCYQKYEGYQSNSCWKRYATGADTWSAWTKISAV